ncbi:hypothetical protein F5888DRAFT_1704550 [Russula emetica]|nr:hypothetical protein F5888DRAFT_1704550 [Russula emetica]
MTWGFRERWCCVLLCVADPTPSLGLKLLLPPRIRGWEIVAWQREHGCQCGSENKICTLRNNELQLQRCPMRGPGEVSTQVLYMGGDIGARGRRLLYDVLPAQNDGRAG